MRHGASPLALALALGAWGLASHAAADEREGSRVATTVRPFLSVIGKGAGGVANLTVEHQFSRPWKVGVEVAPLAVIVQPSGTGAITHARLHGAFSSELVEVGAGFGARLQRYGQSGYSAASRLRLGALDGLHFELEYAYSIYRSYYTDKVVYGMSNISGEIAVPVSRRAALVFEGGFGFDLWAYTTLGLRHRLRGDGGPGTLAVGAGAGVAWVLDRLPCLYNDPTPCRDARWGFGPTIVFHIDRRF